MESERSISPPPIARRTFLRWTGLAAAAPAVLLSGGGAGSAAPRRPAGAGSRSDDLAEATIAQLQDALSAGRTTSVELVEEIVERIARLDERGPTLRAMLELNPEAEAIAAVLDRERAEGRVRGPLHGVPLLVKDNLDTADRMTTTAGSLALAGTRRTRDATAAARLREAGAVLLGKTNLSEWANFRSSRSTSGWSSRGGQCRNPYALDRSPCGSSSGSAVAVAAGYVPASVGTETDGSIVCPAAACSLVGIKPTLGLVSRAGVVPIAHSQDTVGPLARTIADAALVLAAMAGADDRDAETAGAPRHSAASVAGWLDAVALRGARIGVARERYFGYSQETDRVIEEALAALRDAGAVLVDPADLPSAAEMAEDDGELEVLLYEFKADLNAYLSGLGNGAPVRSLADVIAFNAAHAETVMPFFGQDLFEQAQAKGPLTEPAYREALARNRTLSRERGIDAALREHRLDALVAPTGAPPFKIDLVNGDHFLGGSSSPAALAGYPAVTLPAGYAGGLPVGITFFGTAWSEPTLIRLAYAFEQATRARRQPEFPPTLDPPTEPLTRRE